MADYESRRVKMVQDQIATRGIHDVNVLRAMRTVPRERFVDSGMAEFAYEDSPLPIGEGQTISQPYIVAAMIEAAGISATDRVLDVGAGSGYSTAVTSLIAAKVYAVERHEWLVQLAQERFDSLGYRNIELRTGDGTLGWPEVAPFDAILVAAGGPGVPVALKAQLVIGGRLVMPVGEAEHQRLVKVTRASKIGFDQNAFTAVSFVPLIGEQGWTED